MAAQKLYFRHMENQHGSISEHSTAQRSITHPSFLDTLRSQENIRGDCLKTPKENDSIKMNYAQQRLGLSEY